MTESSDFRRISLENTSGRNLSFTGKLLASAASSSNNAHSNYSGSPGRHKKLSIYITRTGKWVLQKVDSTQWQGENDRYETLVAESKEEVFKFFGHGWLAKQLYENAEISDAIEVD